MTDKVKTIKKMNNMLYLVNFNNKGYSKILLRIIQNVDKPKYLEFYSTDWTLSIKDVKKYQQKEKIQLLVVSFLEFNGSHRLRHHHYDTLILV